MFSCIVKMKYLRFSKQYVPWTFFSRFYYSEKTLSHLLSITNILYYVLVRQVAPGRPTEHQWRAIHKRKWVSVLQTIQFYLNRMHTHVDMVRQSFLPSLWMLTASFALIVPSFSIATRNKFSVMKAGTTSTSKEHVLLHSANDLVFESILRLFVTNHICQLYRQNTNAR